MKRKREEIKLTEFEQQIADQLKAGKPLTGEGGIFTPIMKRVLESMLQAEMSAHLQEEENNRRNGLTTKKVKSSLGSFELFSPRDRAGSFEPEVVKKRQTTLSEDIDRKILSLFTYAMSYTDIRSHISEIYGIEPSDAMINEVTDRIMPDLVEWRSRPLEELYCIVWLDAIHYSIREDGIVKKKAVYCALGMDMEGKKDVLGFYIGDTEGAKFWLQVLFDLQNRGVKDILIACTDNLSGFVTAIQSVFPHTECQLCIVHQVRNTIKNVSYKHVSELTKDLRTIYQAPSKQIAAQSLEVVKNKWSKQYPRMMDSWYRNWDNLSHFFKYPEQIRRLIYTTNTVEGFHRMLRKATKTKGAFTSENALSKLIYLTILKAKQKWSKSIYNWKTILTQLYIYFENRLPN